MNKPEMVPQWAEIKHDHHEETDGFIVAYVDAWKTGNDDEEGVVIAKIIGARIDGEPKTYISYQNAYAMVDANAKAAIEEAQREVIEALKEAEQTK